MEEEKIPGFIQHYMDRLYDNGYREFTMLSREYKKAIETYNHTNYPEQSKSMEMHNKLHGSNKTIDYQAGLDAITKEHEQKALELAKQHGYKDEVYDKDLTEKQDKLNDLLSSRKEAEKTALAEQQQEKPAEPELTPSQIKRQKFLEEQKKITEPFAQRGQEKERD